MVSAPVLSSVCLAGALLGAAGVALNARTLAQVSEPDDGLDDEELLEPDDRTAPSLEPEPNGELLFDILATHASEQIDKFDILRRPQARLSAGPNISLLTSIFLEPLDMRRTHEMEILAAFATNVENPFISNIHVLLESKRDDNCSGLRGLLEKAISKYQNRSLTQYHKVECVEVHQRPLYGYFFRYANTSMGYGTQVMISNADVVYDETLAQLPPVEAGLGVHLMSVMPPPYEGAFRDTFHMWCGGKAIRERRCEKKTRSWDAYVFRTPLPARLKDFDLEFPMSVPTSEFYVAGALLESGLKLTNPCMFVHAWHWHCFGQKMHAMFDKKHHRHEPTWSHNYTSHPCWDFPKQQCH